MNIIVNSFVICYIAQALASGNIGKYNQEGLPNITGRIIPYTGYGGSSDGAFFSAAYPDSRTASWGSGATNYTSFDASRSNPIYGNSEHVTPNHIQYPLFICISNIPVPATEAQYNQFIEGLNNKANIDGSNATLNNLNNNALNNLILKAFPDFETEAAKSWNTVYQTENSVVIIGSARTLSNNAPKVQVSKDNATYYNLWTGEGYLVNGSPSFNLTIPKGYYYKGTGGTDGNIMEYRCVGS